MDDPRPRPLFTRPLRGARLVGSDVLAGLLLTALPLLDLLVGRSATAPSVPVWVGCVAAAGTGLPVAVRRRWPRRVLGVTLATSLVAQVLGIVRQPCLAAALALYLVALTEPPRRWIPTRAIGVVSVTGVVLALIAGPSAGRASAGTLLVADLLLLGGAWTIGRAVRERRATAAWAARQLADTAVVAERLRIARDLHDIVAHSLGVITVKAGVAHHVLRSPAPVGTGDAVTTDPTMVPDALRDIEAAGRHALTELRHMLDVLRSPTGAVGCPDHDLHPQPGPAALPDLAARATLLGVEVRTDLRGTERLGDGVGLTVYRIVQEALTNVGKHAAPTRCTVTVDATGPDVRIEVVDAGRPGGTPARPADAGGRGLAGMRERVAVYGGTLTAAPRPEGGFRVCATLPGQVRPSGENR